MAAEQSMAAEQAEEQSMAAEQSEMLAHRNPSSLLCSLLLRDECYLAEFKSTHFYYEYEFILYC